MKKKILKIVKKKKVSKIDEIMNDTYTGDDVKRYIGAVTEEFRSHVSAVAEQFLGLRDNVETLQGAVMVIDEKLDGLTEHVDVLDQKVDTLTERVDVLDQKVDTLTEHVDVLDQKVDTLTERVDVLDKKVDVTESKAGRLEDASISHTEMLGRLMIGMGDVKVGMQEKVSRTEFNKLETRLVAIETIVFTGHKKKTTRM